LLEIVFVHYIVTKLSEIFQILGVFIYVPRETKNPGNEIITGVEQKQFLKTVTRTGHVIEVFQG